MSSFETTATVAEEGEVRVAGVPFAVGTEVDVTISRKARPAEAIDSDTERLAAARARMQELFQTVQGFRMTPKISREELYDRRSLR